MNAYKYYKPAKDSNYLVFIVLLGIVSMIPIIPLFRHGGNGFWVYLIIVLVVQGLFFWTWFDTGYIIRSFSLQYKSGPLRGTIDIAKIQQISFSESPGSGVRPALSSPGLLIKYSKWDSIFVSPLDTRGFIDDILKINPTIQVQADTNRND